MNDMFLAKILSDFVRNPSSLAVSSGGRLAVLEKPDLDRSAIDVVVFHLCLSDVAGQ